MRKLFSIICSLVLMIGVLLGCQTTNKTDEAAPQTNAANGEQQAERKQYQAVCTDKQSHGGSDYVLTKWLDSKDKALVYGREHEMKNRGHVIKYNERDKP